MWSCHEIKAYETRDMRRGIADNGFCSVLSLEQIGNISVNIAVKLSRNIVRFFGKTLKRRKLTRQSDEGKEMPQLNMDPFAIIT